MELFWIFMFLIFLIGEILTFSFCSIFFSLGSLISYFLAFKEYSLKTQIISFIVVSVISLILFRSFMKKKLNIKEENSVEEIEKDPFIDEIGIVEEINDNILVKVSGSYIIVESDSDLKLKDKVRIKKVIKKGSIYYVEKIEEREENK